MPENACELYVGFVGWRRWVALGLEITGVLL
jgi:hypothetical protein